MERTARCALPPPSGAKPRNETRPAEAALFLNAIQTMETQGKVGRLFGDGEMFFIGVPLETLERCTKQ